MKASAEQRAAAIMSNVETIKTPPFSVEAEQAVLGGIMIDATALAKVADVVGPDDFYRGDHRLIYRAILEQDARDHGIDAVTLGEYLASRHELDNAGGLAYLATLARDTPTSANCRTYAEIVRDRSMRRQLIAAGTEIAEQGYSTRTDLRETLDEAQRLVMNLGENRHDTGPAPIQDSIGHWLDSMTLRSEAADGILGLRTGLAHLDEFTCGMSCC